MHDQRELLVELKTGRTRPVVARAPLVSSADFAWRGVLLEHHQVRPFEANDVRLVNNVIFIQLGAPCTLNVRLNGHFQESRILPGQFSLIPACLPHSVRTSDSAGEFLLVSVESRFLACTAEEFVDPGRMELTPILASTDSLIEGICMNLLAEAQAGAPGARVYSDSLTSALAAHLIRKYCLRESPPRKCRGGLSKQQLHRALDFINDHFEQEISLHVIASAVGMSPYHFAHQFKRSTSLAPHQYLIRCRLERARHMLFRSEGSLAEVAVRVGFCDQSHFTQHFKRVYGMTPKTFVREMSADNPALSEAKDLPLGMAN